MPDLRCIYSKRAAFFWLGFCAVVLALLFLWDRHAGHVFGLLPYLLVLLCPLSHLLMHRKHHS